MVTKMVNIRNIILMQADYLSGNKRAIVNREFNEGFIFLWRLAYRRARQRVANKEDCEDIASKSMESLFITIKNKKDDKDIFNAFINGYPMGYYYRIIDSRIGDFFRPKDNRGDIDNNIHEPVEPNDGINLIFIEDLFEKLDLNETQKIVLNEIFEIGEINIKKISENTGISQYHVKNNKEIIQNKLRKLEHSDI